MAVFVDTHQHTLCGRESLVYLTPFLTFCLERGGGGENKCYICGRRGGCIYIIIIR